MLEEAGGVFAFASPVGKPFIIAGGEEIVKDVLIHHASHYGKQHANGILEIFRKTALPTSGIPAWRPVNKIASRISRNSGTNSEKSGAPPTAHLCNFKVLFRALYRDLM
jgi:hypothetical protein